MSRDNSEIKGKILGYVRVSTKKQEQGLRAQIDAIQARADYFRGENQAEIEWFQDIGVSGKRAWDDRPAMRACIGALKRGDVLIVQRRDRIARDAVQAMVIDRLVMRVGASIESADGARWDDTPESRLIRGILDVFSEYERRIISMRTAAAKEAARQRGEHVSGCIPYGMMRDPENPKMLITSLEWAVIKDEIMTPHSEGVSFRKIAERMNKKNQAKEYFLPKYRACDRARTKAWTKTTVHRIWQYHDKRLKREEAKRERAE